MQYSNFHSHVDMPSPQRILPAKKAVENLRKQEIIGDSEASQKIQRLIATVAPSESTVLLLGETGTGKEMIARAIHYRSSRSNKSMIKVNCAALPPNLIESELFGHERGSFTGAFDKRIGKFELAHGGTLFLDEIGEMPIDLQVKLLRVLQEKELERVGGRASIKVDVRIIAATNRDLEKEMAQGRFRPDLYYRLNVFPIMVPPLRERRSDIPSLAQYFLQHYASRENKRITKIPDRYMAALLNYNWPGNIRELENIIERSVLMSDGKELQGLPMLSSGKAVEQPQHAAIKTMAENEKDHILKALSICNHKLYGPGGAAELLGINASTLKSRMNKLGIGKKFMA
jgi:formate hydrogenlyase transcriptional activator